MRCKLFKLHTQNESGESNLNKFLESVVVKQIFSQIINEDGHFWSVLVFYEESATVSEKSRTAISQTENVSAVEAPKSQEKTESEAVSLTPEQEEVFNLLKKWRNEKASRDGIPPYMIAHNLSLLQIAASTIKSKAELIEIKGFGEKRAEKYGDEILEILGVSANESDGGD